MITETDVRDRLRRSQIAATVTVSKGLAPGACRGCPAFPHPHRAQVVCTVGLVRDSSPPALNLTGFCTPVCWRGLVEFLREARTFDGFEGFSLEIPVT